MLKPGRMKDIMEEIGKARVDVVAVQEICWQGQGRIDKDFSLFYSGSKERTGRYWTGFIINTKMRKSFLSFGPLSDRLCKLRLRGKFRNITLISTYAPTGDSPDAIKDVPPPPFGLGLLTALALTFLAYTLVIFSTWPTLNTLNMGANAATKPLVPTDQTI